MQNSQILQRIHLASLLCFSSHGEESVKRHWPLTMSQLSVTGKDETDPLIPQNLDTDPIREQCPSSEIWLQHMLPSYEAHTEADWTRFPTVPSPQPSPARIYKMVCYYSLPLSQGRNPCYEKALRMHTELPGPRAEVRRTSGEICSLPMERMLEMALGKGARTSTSSRRMQPSPPTCLAGKPQCLRNRPLREEDRSPFF